MSILHNFMTQAEFARDQNVSRKTVSVWKREGRLVMDGNRVNVAASVERLGDRARKRTDDESDVVTLSAIDAVFPSDPLPSEAITASVAIEQGAADLARLLVARMPRDEARDIVDAWVAAQRAGWVGGPGHPVSIAEDEGWPLPAGCDRWSDHPLFTGPAISDVDWSEAQAEAPREDRHAD